MKHGLALLCKALPALAMALCAGCASVQPPVAAAMQAQPAGRPDAALRQRQDRLLAQPLSQDAAAELALLHPALTPHFSILGIDAASRLRMAHALPPGAGPVAAAESKVERTPTLYLATWLAAPALRAQQMGATAGPGEPGRSIDADMAAADAIGDWVFSARRAWVRAIAARQALHHANESASLAEAGHELARNRRQAGNAAALDALKAQQHYQEAMARKAQRDAQARLLREQLHYRTGIWGIASESIRLADRLPELPPASVNAEGLEALAVSRRLDLQVARAALAQHGADTAPSAFHEAHQALLDATALRARMEVRSAWIGYRSRLELARHACEVALPLAQRIAQEQGRRYNGMLVSVFDMLAGKADRIDAGKGCSAAQAAFWLAEVDLQQALAGTGRPPAPAAQGSAAGNGAAGHGDGH
jgi:hypothetical protein